MVGGNGSKPHAIGVDLSRLCATCVERLGLQRSALSNQSRGLLVLAR